ncbi:MAG TPA: hypothetical protein VKN99_26720 [Polyangia bacterium]|nr:hypothetical protein [Polyangia bacterium]
MDRPLTVFRRHEEQLYLGAAGLVIAVAALLPLLVLCGQLVSSTAPASGPAATLASARIWLLLARSLGVAAAVTALALGVGVPLGFIFARTDAPGRWVAFALHAFPMFVPPFLLALGWFHWFGRQGLLGSETSSRALFSAGGLIAILVATFTPIVTSLAALALSAIDPALEEAARVVARPWRVATRISLGAIRPALALAALIVFALSLSELGVPTFLRVDLYPSAVFARLGGVDYAPGEAVALVLPLLGLALILLVAERRFVGARSFAVLGARAAERFTIPLGRWRVVGALAGLLAAVVGLAPLGALIGRAGLGGFSSVPAWMGGSLWNSLAEASLAASIMTALGIVVGRALARRRRAAAPLDALAMLAFVMPASVLGVGILATWNRSATAAIYGSLAIVVIGWTARYLIVSTRTIAIAVAQSPLHLEEAAAAVGSPFGRRLRRIVMPLHRRGIAAAWLLAFVFCLRDLETVVLFYPAGREPLTVRIFTLEANGPPAAVAALAALQIAVVAGVVAGAGVAQLAARTGPR